MAIHADLLDLEKQFWNGDAEFYRNNLDDKCLVAFKDMAGVMRKNDIAEMVNKDPPRWSDLEFEDKGFVEPTDGVVVFSYQASGKRGSGEKYEAIVSSGYVRRNGFWKMAFHQQTPLENDRGAKRQ
jgi:hypothetical protein